MSPAGDVLALIKEHQLTVEPYEPKRGDPTLLWRVLRWNADHECFDIVVDRPDLDAAVLEVVRQAAEVAR